MTTRICFQCESANCEITSKCQRIIQGRFKFSVPNEKKQLQKVPFSRIFNVKKPLVGLEFIFSISGLKMTRDSKRRIWDLHFAFCILLLQFVSVQNYCTSFPRCKSHSVLKLSAGNVPCRVGRIELAKSLYKK